MARIDDLLTTALKTMPTKPPGSATPSMKKAYSETKSAKIALAMAEQLRHRDMRGARPSGPGEVGASRTERRLAGAFGAKKVDVTWATEESGLLLGISVKTIDFRDGRSNSFQKSLTNRRGDMLGEAPTLHRRFRYAVVAGILFLDKDAKNDQTTKRNSTFVNAFPGLRIFTGSEDPAGRDGQFERLYLQSVDANQFNPTLECFQVNDSTTPVALEASIDVLVVLVAERNFDFYDAHSGTVRCA